MRVLVTGGSGYIGSHTCVQLLQNGHDVIILDNLCNSKRSVLPVIERLGGKHPTFVEGDIRNEALMTEILHDHAIDTVIHFAGLKAVGESVQKPLEYYDNNVNGTLRLISAMRAANVKNFIFSSSATVYGDQPKIPYVESFPTGTPQSPYGKSKLMVEQILTDLQKAQPDWSIALLRYFNPVGAHPSGDMGEDPQGIPNNLMPYIAQVAVGRRDSLAIFGNDYPTEDGTGVRDYIHVMDLTMSRTPVRLICKVLGMGVAESVNTSNPSDQDFHFSFCITPKRCSSSTTSNPKRRNLTLSDKTACVPITTSSSPLANFSKISFFSFAVVKRFKMAVFTPNASIRSVNVL